jgi:hypothetical protein
MTSTEVLRIVAMTSLLGVDRTLAELIEEGLIDADQHIMSDDYIFACEEVADEYR